MNNKLNIFLDLEETVIDDWVYCNFLYYKIDIIKKIIEDISIKYFSEKVKSENINLILFSAAVVTESDLKIFNHYIKPILEKHLGLTFSSEFLFSNENWRELAEINGIKTLNDDSMIDIFNFNVKEQIFELIYIKNEINILFDDTVQNKITNIFDGDLFSKKQSTLICIDMK